MECKYAATKSCLLLGTALTWSSCEMKSFVSRTKLDCMQAFGGSLYFCRLVLVLILTLKLKLKANL